MKKLFLACTMVFASAAAADAAPYKSMTIDLPAGTNPYPGGPDVAAVNRNCLACHSSDFVLEQPLLSRAAWAAEVAKMRANYKAPIGDADVGPIVDYLAATHGDPTR